MPTILDFLADPYRAETEAIVLKRNADRLILDRTVLYPGVGISPADSGWIFLEDGRSVRIKHCIWDDGSAGVLEHICERIPADVQAGMKVVARIDWFSRYAAMRIHTALHLVSIGFPYPMVDGIVQVGWGNALFQVDRSGVRARELQTIVEGLIAQRLPVTAVWVQPPVHDVRINIRSFEWPGANGLARAMKIDEIDLQPCDGLHVRNTAEVGDIELTSLLRVSAGLYRANVRLLDIGGPGNATRGQS